MSAAATKLKRKDGFEQVGGLRFIHHFTAHPPLCEVEDCVSKAESMYADGGKRGWCLCVKHAPDGGA